ncbi:MAG TPA: acyl-CoA dehydrogenase family protein, partial [Burkholderiales bacterium]|nr:acyl-CoA dehydrogenase family protein [Burkholderiales bacterium]
VLVAAEDRVGLVAAKEGRSEPEKNLAGEPRPTLRFDGARLEAVVPLKEARERLMREGALARGVQMAGALERTLELALAYANERVQFGRPIGKFQAVQHMLAQLAAHVAASSAAADAAVEASSTAADAFAVAVAKARISEAAGKAAEIAHQVHGAMGFTREHVLHYSTRRLWSWRDEFGSELHWQARLGREAAAAGGDGLWSLLTRL